jgi:hypothetical protein
VHPQGPSFLHPLCPYRSDREKAGLFHRVSKLGAKRGRAEARGNVIARKLDKQGVSSGRLNSTIATPRSSQRGSERAGWRLATDGRTGVEPMSAAQHRASMTATPQQPVPRIPSRAWFACCPTRPASGRALRANPTLHTAGESFVDAASHKLSGARRTLTRRGMFREIERRGVERKRWVSPSAAGPSRGQLVP